MIRVPNTSIFSLQDVRDAMLDIDPHIVSSDITSLEEMFDKAITPYFDNNYKGDKNSLYNFRNYGIGGCALATSTNPTWWENSDHYGLNTFNLNLAPSGINHGGTWSSVGHRWYMYLKNTDFGGQRYAYMQSDSSVVTIFSTNNDAFYMTVRLIREASSSELNLADGTTVTDNYYEDGDGNRYDGIKVGAYIWLNRNLKSTTYPDGTDIPSNYIRTSGPYTGYTSDHGFLYDRRAINNGVGTSDPWFVPHEVHIVSILDYLKDTYFPNISLGQSSFVARLLKSCRQVNHPLDS